MNKKIWIRGAGDLATGIALRFFRSGFDVIMSDIAVPTTVRRTVAFSPAIYEGEAIVEGISGKFCDNISEIDSIIESGAIPIIVDPSGDIMREYKPEVIVDAIIAKTNIGTGIDDAKIVIGVGPGFEAGVDCHAVVETKRGHNLGRVIWSGSAYPNTGVPGNIGGYTVERIIRATADGIFKANVSIGDSVKAGDLVAYCDKTPVYAGIDGIVRGLLQDGVKVKTGMKSGDVDPRAQKDYCFSVSDKARAIGGGVLEAVLGLMSSRKI
ncbi:selenium-dependent molybdenum cofactor biosynthesis protein YqeB [Lachnoanaerobaculum umeaense]|jgi:selenium-dependent molybdenum hydroxylase system protein, yqeB family|uniref:EF2563 family selenium-dependent molybdenum hydroxylase system protein n=1 Tax=Lachnoanaerobaculum umeaense TaxID=617123 RepID=A0A385PYE9_9FIRM|nr:selenium-dependent molybdenum cofactor biosynthesis protein YqeB [Lachnoanaerobaculum umeaense]AYA99022.1 EF2563 family selenium-dependent molybdenum hydroxylase system protein [Lachnoanaerobaculum umeaense]PZW95151.1 xanthine dehydrogenase accessory factor [Lachnoanaerobaculum umeaense]